ncbi:MAG: cyclic dehypoxanthinyl futalosine synthase [Bacteroidia bacterium]|nr:dehypoxanthine futalosine cyclase [Bacteroidia bacterium]MDW8134584.1 cyclic dehypoxanthinyl futalosine synthase [Bacteroidia bacterium]
MNKRSIQSILEAALSGEFLSVEEGVRLFYEAPLPSLMAYAHALRLLLKADTPNIVTWQIDRNVNTTNICVANCKFCNFFRPPGHKEGYVTDDETYRRKIEETLALGGDQLLLQGGHHPDLGLAYYEELFRKLKSWYPHLKLHALSPPEIVHIAEMEGLSYEEVLRRLRAAGLDSLPGAGAEILVDEVRRVISAGKCTADQWLEVMRTAHRLNIPSSATMMFGHVETIPQRMEHLVKIRSLQAEKPEGSLGFTAFILWPFQDKGTKLRRVRGVKNQVTPHEYIRMLAIARLMLPNIPNIQVSWLTVGPEIAQVCLHAGANDMGSIMIEENVVSAAGASYRFTAKEIQAVIRSAGFEPRLRDQLYRFREEIVC